MSDDNPFERGGLGEDTNSPEQEAKNLSVDEDKVSSIRHDGYTFSLLDAKRLGEKRLRITLPNGRTCSLPSPPGDAKIKRGYKIWENLVELIDGTQKVMELSGEDFPSTDKSYLVAAAVEKFLHDWIVGGDESEAAEWYRRREEMWSTE